MIFLKLNEKMLTGPGKNCIDLNDLILSVNASKSQILQKIGIHHYFKRRSKFDKTLNLSLFLDRPLLFDLQRFLLHYCYVFIAREDRALCFFCKDQIL